MPENLENRAGVWYYRAVINGKLHRKSTGFKVSTRQNQQAALRRASEIENEIRSGNLGWMKPPAPLFSVWAEHFLLSHHPGRATEALLMRRPLRLWGDRRIDSITQSECRGLLTAWQQDGAKKGTLERMRVLLAQAFRAAVMDKKIDESPMQGIRSIRREPKGRLLTREYETVLRKALTPMWDRYLTLSLLTGVRRAELLGFRPCDLREGGTWIWVRPECNKLRKGRLVPLKSAALKTLEAQRVACPSAIDTAPYFTVKRHTPTCVFRQRSRRAGIPVVTPHDFRRTFGTRCAEGGMHPKKLQLIMGHESMEITMRYYVHLEHQSLAAALEGVTL